MMICEHCDKELTKEDDYAKHDDERYCANCCVRSFLTVYHVGGEFLGTDDDVEIFSKYTKVEVTDDE